MSRANDANVGTTTIRDGYRFDERRLAAWMQSNVDGYHGPLKVEQFRGGQSNPTYKLLTADRSYVLRRKPPGQLLKGAHAVEREAKLLTAVRSVGFPVPRAYGVCTEDSVIGTWLSVMGFVAGRFFW